LFLFTAVCILLLVTQTNAQTTYGTIVGTVVDASGAAIPNAQVTLNNVGTNERRTTTTSADGLYQFPNLVPGDYRVEVGQTGFKRLVRGPVTVQVESTARVDFALEVGDASQTVEVTAEAPLLQPDSSSLGTVV